MRHGAHDECFLLRLYKCLTGPSGHDKLQFAPAADVYSFGILISTVFNQKEPYDKLPASAIMAGVLAGQLRPVLPECLADEVRCGRVERVCTWVSERTRCAWLCGG